MKMTAHIAWCAAIDAANRNAGKHGRSRWNEDDYNVAVAKYKRLWPEEAESAA